MTALLRAEVPVEKVEGVAEVVGKGLQRAGLRCPAIQRCGWFHPFAGRAGRASLMAKPSKDVNTEW
jgi:hypothetical protein